MERRSLCACACACACVCPCAEMHAVFSLCCVARTGTMSLDMANVLSTKRRRGNDGKSKVKSASSSGGKMSSANTTKASKIKNASSSGRKATSARQSVRNVRPRIRLTPPIGQTVGGLSVGARSFLTLVRHKLSSRVVDIPLAPEMLQLPFYEKGMGYGPFDEDTATTTKGYFKTFRHHRHDGEPISAEMISVFCDVLSSFATNLGGGQAPAPRPSIAEATSGGQAGDSPKPHPPGTSSAAYLTHAGVEGTKASVLEEFEHMWAKGLLCHARCVYMFLRITPPIVKCFVHAHVLSPFTTDREVFVPYTCCLPSSPPIVKCYFHLHVYSRFTSDREALSPHVCRALFVHVSYLSIHLRCLLPRYFILFRCFPRASGANQVRMSVYLSSRERQEM